MSLHPELLDFQPFLEPDSVGSGGPSVIYQNPEGRGELEDKEIDQGYLGDILRDITLRGYIHENDAVEQSIPRVAEQILKDAFFDRKDVTKVYVTQRVAREAAIGEAPKHFWKYGRVAGKIAEEIGHLNVVPKSDQEAQRIGTAYDLANGLSTAAADMDMKVRYKGKNFFPRLVKSIAIRYGVEDKIEKTQIGKDLTGNPIYRTEFAFVCPEQKGLTIRVYEGPTLASPRRRNVYLSFHRSKDQDPSHPLFRIDVGEFARQESAGQENRVGRTTRKQDELRLRMVKENNRLRCYQRYSELRIMGKRDQIWKEADNPADLMQISVRALRQNLFHDKYIKKLYNLEHFLPFFTRGSVDHMRRQVRKFILNGKEAFEESTVPKLMQEVAICLMVDPYTTVQFFRDTGVSLLIPGLRKITRPQWDAVLRSGFMEAVSNDGVWASSERRTLHYMNSQRQKYREQGMTRGLSMFIHALGELNLIATEPHDWVSFVKLWEPRRLENLTVGTVSPDTGEDETVQPTLYRVEIFSGKKIGLTGERSMTSRELKEGIRLLHQTFIDELNSDLNSKDRAKLYLIMRDIAHLARRHPTFRQRVDEYQDLQERREVHRFLTPQESEDLRETEDWLYSMVLVYSILTDFPPGLTEEEIDAIYSPKKPKDIVPDEFPHLPFKRKDMRTTFLDLKLLGLIAKEEHYSLSDADTVETAALYSAFPLDVRQTIIGEGVQTSELQWLYARFFGDPIKYGDQVQSLMLSEIFLAFQKYGITTIETIEALTQDDLDILVRDNPQLAQYHVFLNYIIKFQQNIA